MSSINKTKNDSIFWSFLERLQVTATDVMLTLKPDAFDDINKCSESPSVPPFKEFRPEYPISNQLWQTGFSNVSLAIKSTVDPNTTIFLQEANIENITSQ